MKIGMLGLPQAGKKTLFYLLTGAKLDSNAFSKGKSPSGVAKIQDSRLEKLTAMYKPKKTTPATIEITLSTALDQENPSFASLQGVDILCHVVRVFESDQVFHVKGSVDPRRDIEQVNNELTLSDWMFIEKRMEKIEKEKGKKKTLPGEEELLLKMKQHLEEQKPLRTLDLRDDQKEILSVYPFLTMKNMMVVLNVHEKDLSNESFLKKLQENFSKDQMDWVVISGKLEEELQSLSAEEQQEYCKEFGIEKRALEKLTLTSYKTLGLISFFTVGEDEVRAWTIPHNSLAPRAARAIHTDLERGFIRAEVMKYTELVENGSEKKLKETGKYYTKGKDYVVEDGDILHILFNV